MAKGLELTNNNFESQSYVDAEIPEVFIKDIIRTATENSNFARISDCKYRILNREQLRELMNLDHAILDHTCDKAIKTASYGINIYMPGDIETGLRSQKNMLALGSIYERINLQAYALQLGSTLVLRCTASPMEFKDCKENGMTLMATVCIGKQAHIPVLPHTGDLWCYLFE